jgi:hypothetical protein
MPTILVFRIAVGKGACTLHKKLLDQARHRREYVVGENHRHRKSSQTVRERIAAPLSGGLQVEPYLSTLTVICLNDLPFRIFASFLPRPTKRNPVTTLLD